MNQAVLKLLKCPACGQSDLSQELFRQEDDDERTDGILWCPACLAWYPIEDGLLEFLTGSLVYGEDRKRFWGMHAKRLKALDLRPTGDGRAMPESGLETKQQAHFDWYADNHSQTYLEYERQPFWVAADEIAFRSWRQDIQPDRWLLDVGCAQGRSTFKVMNMDVNVVAFDVSKRLIRQAIHRYREGNYRAKATFFVADASIFPIIDGAFDYVLLYGVLHHFSDPGRGCQEISRVLKPGGIYFGNENNRSVFRGVFDLIQKIKPLWHEEAGTEPQISSDRLKKLFQSTSVRLETKTSIFLPPHMINFFSYKVAYELLNGSDRIGRAMPFLRDNGGLVLIRGYKSQDR